MLFSTRSLGKLGLCKNDCVSRCVAPNGVRNDELRAGELPLIFASLQANAAGLRLAAVLGYPSPTRGVFLEFYTDLLFFTAGEVSRAFHKRRAQDLHTCAYRIAYAYDEVVERGGSNEFSRERWL